MGKVLRRSCRACTTVNAIKFRRSTSIQRCAEILGRPFGWSKKMPKAGQLKLRAATLIMQPTRAVSWSPASLTVRTYLSWELIGNR